MDFSKITSSIFVFSRFLTETLLLFALGFFLAIVRSWKCSSTSSPCRIPGWSRPFLGCLPLIEEKATAVDLGTFFFFFLINKSFKLALVQKAVFWFSVFAQPFQGFSRLFQTCQFFLGGFVCFLNLPAFLEAATRQRSLC